MTATTAHRSSSRVDEGWVRCPKCRQLFKREHRCSTPLGERVTHRPADFDAQVEQARREALADALAGEQLALDAPPPAACSSCGCAGLPLDEDTGTCTGCMARAAREAAGLPPRAGPP